MIIKIAGQSTKTNYQNTGSCGAAVTYNEHELRDLPQLFQKLGVKPEDLSWFDMDGQAVTGAEVMDKIGRLTAHLGKDDAKFYCIMINPSNDEAKAMGLDIEEQITNGQPYVFDIMDAYADNFHKENVKDRHDTVAYAIPHIYKSGGKQQIHWHVIVARLSRGFKVEIGEGKYRTKHYKLSPLTNHVNTTKGCVKGGFSLVDFDAKCETLFDVRFEYDRKVEESFEYCLAEKKGTAEEKIDQENRLALQNMPALERSIKAAIARRKERLTREATELDIKEQPALTKALREVTQEIKAEEIEKDFLNLKEGYESIINTSITENIKELREKTYNLYIATKKAGININNTTTNKYKGLLDTWKQYHTLQDELETSESIACSTRVLGGILTCLNPIIGLAVMAIAGIAGDVRKSKYNKQKQQLLDRIEEIKTDLTVLQQEKANLQIQKKECLQEYLDVKKMYKEYADGLNNIDTQLNETKLDKRREKSAKQEVFEVQQNKPQPIHSSKPTSINEAKPIQSIQTKIWLEHNNYDAVKLPDGWSTKYYSREDIYVIQAPDRQEYVIPNEGIYLINKEGVYSIRYVEEQRRLDKSSKFKHEYIPTNINKQRKTTKKL